MTSYYDDPDFSDEYHRRDEEALTAYLEERERDDTHYAVLEGETDD